MFCQNCAAPVDEKANYCSVCGYALRGQTGEKSTKKPHAAPKWFKWLLGIVLFAGICGFVLAATAEDFTDTVYDQLRALKKNKITEAYYSFTSKEFQSATTLEQFKAFLAAYPILLNTKGIRFIDKTSSDHQGTLEAFLTNNEGHEVKAVYRTIKEGDKWKILSISLEDGPFNHPNSLVADASPSNLGDSKPLEFSQFVIGTDVDEEGRVSVNQNSFPAAAQELYLNLYITNGSKDTPVEVNLEHLDSHSKIIPIRTKLTTDGHTILTFVFSPPPVGWPKGNYEVSASTPAGTENHLNFKIE